MTSLLSAGDMEAHMDRFRVKLSSNSPASPPANSFSPSSPLPNIGRILACDRCRHFKKKCSRTFPECAACVTAGQRCSLAAAVSTTMTEADLRSRLMWMESFINQRQLLGPDRTIDRIATGTDLTVLSELSGPPDTPEKVPARVQAKTNLSVTAAESRNSVSLPPLATGRPLDDAPRSANSDRNSVPSPKRRRLESSPSMDGTHSLLSKSTMASEQPQRRLDDRAFVDAYFHDVSRVWPFLDRTRILSILESKRGRVFSIRDERDTDSIILHLVIAIGHITLVRAGQVRDDPADTRFAVDYKDILAECLLPETIHTVQILLLLSIYSVSDPRAFSTRAIVDMLAGQAIRLGLTRRGFADDGRSTEDAEMIHRLFWSIYVIDRMVAFSTGTTVSVSDADRNMPLPGMTKEEFTSPDSAENASTLQVSRHIIQLRKLEDDVLYKVHLRDRVSLPGSFLAQSAEDYLATVTKLRTAIEDWHSNGYLLNSVDVSDNVRIHVSIPWLSSHYYHLLLFLYYPSRFKTATPSLLSNGELASLAQKHVQALVVRTRNTQLPMNHVTLCRLLPVCMVFLHCWMSRRAGEPLLNIREEVTSCSEILDAYPAHWHQAHRAAAIMRQLGSLISSATSTSGNTYDPVRFTSHTPTQSSSRTTLSGSDRARCREIKATFTELAQQVLGKGSAYQLPDDLEAIPSDIGVRTPDQYMSTGTTFPVSTVTRPTISSEDIGRGTASVVGHQFPFASKPFDTESPTRYSDVNDTPQVFSIMDFL